MADKQSYKPRMQSVYEDKVRPALKEQFGYKNALQVPRIEKIVLNMGVGKAVDDKKHINNAVQEMTLISQVKSRW